MYWHCAEAVVGLANHTILIARDGTEIPIDDSAAPIRQGDGPVLGVALVFRDVTEQRAAIALTGYARVEDRSRALRGVSDVCGKTD